MTVPQDYLDRPVAVVGAGTLGRRVALMFTSRGGLVRIIARRADQGAEAVDFVEQQIGGLSGTHPRWERSKTSSRYWSRRPSLTRSSRRTPPRTRAG